MRKKLLKTISFCLLLINFNKGFTQTTCATAKQIWLTCADSLTSTTNVSSQVGPDYGCLATQPNPNWFYFKVTQTGTIDITISQKDLSNGTTDVDFICWGPFSNTNFCSGLTASNTVDCSYSATYPEIANFTGVAGSYYVLLTTNYANIAGKTFLAPNTGTAIIETVASNVSNDTICGGESVLLTASGGYSYLWNTSGTNDSIVESPMSTTTYTAAVTHEFGCTLLTSQTVEVNTGGFHGDLTYSGGAVTSGLVHIIKYQPGNSGGDTISSVTISPTGFYDKGAIPNGMYLLKVDPDTAAYQTLISTYNGNVFRWDSTAPIMHTCSQYDTINIQVLELPIQNGTAKISGHITEGAGYGNRIMNNGNNNIFAPGGPLKGVDIKLGKNPGGGIQSRTLSDSTGYYEFDSIPVGGYTIYVDIPNLPMDSTREVVVNSGTDSLYNNDYKADSIMIFIESTVSIKENKNISVNKVKVFPNPAKENFTISYELEKNTLVKLSIYDIVGKQIKSITEMQQGKQKQLINTDTLTSGVYFVRLEMNGATETLRVIVTK